MASCVGAGELQKIIDAFARGMQCLFPALATVA
jgi:hypothetical protein